MRLSRSSKAVTLAAAILTMGALHAPVLASDICCGATARIVPPGPARCDAGARCVVIGKVDVECTSGSVCAGYEGANLSCNSGAQCHVDELSKASCDVSAGGCKTMEPNYSILSNDELLKMMGY